MSVNLSRRQIDIQKLEELLQSGKVSDKELFKLIVDAPFTYRVETALMFLGIVVLLLVDKKSGQVDRVALSDTEFAKNTTNVSVVPFKEIKIPLTYRKNIIAEAIVSGKPQDTTDWKYLFAPAMNPAQARINQASAGIAYSAVYPFSAREGGALIFSYFQYAGQIGDIQKSFMEKYVNIVNKRLKQKPAQEI